MPLHFPHFAQPQSLPGGARWTAEFESHDERADAVYYCVTRVEPGGSRRELWAQVSNYGIPEPDRIARLLADVARVAAAGESNTTYTGSLMWELRHRARPSS